MSSKSPIRIRPFFRVSSTCPLALGTILLALGAILLALGSLAGCGKDAAAVDDNPQRPVVDREAAIPSDVSKVTPEEDPSPPILHSPEFEEPVPVPVISTAGAEDAPFIPADRDELYFFFAADVREAPAMQIRDPVNGIWVSERVGGLWQEPALVWLQEPGEPALNGCPFVEANEMLFCTARGGYVGLNWFHATFADGEWGSWTLYQFAPELAVGELHISGDELYYHSDLPGGAGGLDIWMASRVDNVWASPVNVSAVNSAADETRPYVSPDGNELWFTRTSGGTPAVFRSEKVDGAWQDPEMIVSRFAGEPTLDSDGNLYFVHHFYQDGVMIEADIYVAQRKQ